MRINTLLPPLTHEEYQSLKADIEKNGILLPIIRTEDGETIDGHHREQIAAELGITDIPVQTVTVQGDEERRHMRIRLNANRRQLSAEQKRNLIREELKRSPDISNNWLAELLAVDDKTVQAVRLEAESAGDIQKVILFRCKDGKKREYRRAIQKENRVAAQATIQDAQESQSPISIISQESQVATAPVQPTIFAPISGEDIQIFHADFRILDIAPASATLILTDPPYTRDSLPIWDDLAVFADRVLKNGGVLLAYAGAMFVSEVIAALSKKLTYRWTFASVHTGPGVRLHCLNLAPAWTPIIMFTKGDYRPHTGTPHRDVISGFSAEKQHHPWQKPLGEIECLLKMFTMPGDPVVDPFGGSFTTAVACKRLGRRCISCDIDQSCVVTGHQRMKEVDLGKLQAA